MAKPPLARMPIDWEVQATSNGRGLAVGAAVVGPVGAVGAAVPESTGVKVNRVSKVLLPLAVLSLVEKVATM
eukprot:scaffold21721_cov145-Amphora_coffeaeformis.AAC.1